ncbi:hypothetical protein ACJJI4_11885 [Microbulbifer sp. TRSA002]|uniref:hypothetical protein n=1 Tax=Microbulbifer sp. TRSA002 TaxID=3243382 RepID=UPI0040399437
MNATTQNPVEMRIYVHIGSDKAGSTAIQSALSENRSILQDQGIYYPKLINSRINHDILVRELKSGKQGPAWNTLNQLIKDSPKQIVLSAESFCTLSSKQIETFKHWLNCSSVSIVAYIRRADEYLESGMLQRLKSAPSLKKFVRQYCYLQYMPAIFDTYVFAAVLKARFIKKWEKHYPGMVSARAYNPSQWEGGDLIIDALGSLGLENRLTSIQLSDSKRNVTPNITAIYAISILSRSKTPGLRNAFSETFKSEQHQYKNGPVLRRTKRAFARYLAQVYNLYALRSHSITFSREATPKSGKQPNLSTLINEAENLVANYLIKKYKPSQSSK